MNWLNASGSDGVVGGVRARLVGPPLGVVPFLGSSGVDFAVSPRRERYGVGWTIGVLGCGGREFGSGPGLGWVNVSATSLGVVVAANVNSP